MNPQDEAACLGAFLGALLREGLRDTAPAPFSVAPSSPRRAMLPDMHLDYDRQLEALRARQETRRMQSEINDLAQQNTQLAALLQELIRQAAASGRPLDIPQLRAAASRLALPEITSEVKRRR
jgi:hypothetical protein